MKPLFVTRLLFCALLGLVLGPLSAGATVKNWTNTAGGNWFDPLSWSPNGVPTINDAVNITNNGTYTVLVSTGTVASAVFTIGGASGKQTLLYGSTAGFAKLYVTNTTIQANGVLMVTNQGMYGSLLVKPGGELIFDTATSQQVYSLYLTNQGTVTCGATTVGGGDSIVTNTGLWQITGTGGTGYGGVGIDLFYNAGTVRKLTGTGDAYFGMDLINLPGGIVDVQAGRLFIAPITGHTNVLTSSYSVAAGAGLILQGNQTDADGILSGAGTNQLNAGNFYARTNIDPRIKLSKGEIYITGTTTFQQGGAITNLTLDGANLHGTNTIAGTLTVNAGNVMDHILVLPGGLLNYVGDSQLYSTPLLVNLGTVIENGNLAFCATPPTVVSNGGTWTITAPGPADVRMSSGGPGTGYFTNAGTIQKTAGAGNFLFVGFPLVNLASGVIRSSSGNLQMPFGFTNAAGTIQLAGGTLSGTTLLSMSGGALVGNGAIGSPAVFDGGMVAPSPGSSQIRFASSLTLGTNCTLSLDGTGTIPGVTYDQLSVTGAVAISNCTLQVASLPSVPAGTKFVIITNTTVNPTTGSFNGLPENTQLTISGQPFRIHYAGGSGNDVVLVRDLNPGAGPQLSNGGYTNKTFQLLGFGNSSQIYTVQASTNLVQWTNAGYATGDVSGNFNFTDTNAANFIRRFYRTTN